MYEKDFVIKPGMNIIDVGANQGFFSLYAAAKEAVVYAIEPEATNFSILRQNIEMNKLEDSIKTYKYVISTKRDK